LWRTKNTPRRTPRWRAALLFPLLFFREEVSVFPVAGESASALQRVATASEEANQPPDQRNQNQNPQQVNQGTTNVCHHNQNQPDDKDNDSNP
jgi:hypothetical protein